MTDEILTMEEAKSILRLTTDRVNDEIQLYIDTIPSYLETTTGYRPIDGVYSPLAKTVAKMLLIVWFTHGSGLAQVSADKPYTGIEKIIDNMLAALSFSQRRSGDNG